MKLSDKLKRLMRLRGFSQQDLARAITVRGVVVSQRAVSKWLQGAEPRADALKALSDEFAVDPEILIDESRALPLAEKYQRLSAEAKRVFPDDKRAEQAAFEALSYRETWRQASLEVAASLRTEAEKLIALASQLEAPFAGTSDLTRDQQKAIEDAEAELARRRKAAQSSDAKAQFGAGS